MSGERNKLKTFLYTKKKEGEETTGPRTTPEPPPLLLILILILLPIIKVEIIGHRIIILRGLFRPRGRSRGGPPQLVDRRLHIPQPAPQTGQGMMGGQRDVRGSHALVRGLRDQNHVRYCSGSIFQIFEQVELLGVAISPLPGTEGNEEHLELRASIVRDL